MKRLAFILPLMIVLACRAGAAISGLPFAEDFEAGGRGKWQVNAGVTFTDREHYQGRWASQITATRGTGNDNYLAYNFGDGTATGQRDLWLRFAHKWSADWDDGGYQRVQKLMILNLHNPETGRRRYQLLLNLWTPDSGYFCEFLRVGEDRKFYGSTTPNVPLNLKRRLGIWTEFVFRVRMNTPGKRDGILQVWSKDEDEATHTLRVNRDDINYRDATEFSPNRLIQSNYQPETVFSGTRWWDAWQLGEEPLLPDASAK